MTMNEFRNFLLKLLVLVSANCYSVYTIFGHGEKESIVRIFPYALDLAFIRGEK